MCDKCAVIFSERAEGWSTYTGTRMVTDPRNGRRVEQTDQMDTCPSCSGLDTPMNPTVRTAIGTVPASQGAADRLADTLPTERI